MAKVVSNPIVRGLSGKLGDQVVFRHWKNGKTTLAAMPDFSKRKFSKGQKTHQSRFKDATAYARAAAKTQPIYAKLAAGTGKTAYNFALSDWFNPPVIHEIEKANGRMRVRVSDKVMVARVNVAILGEDGKVREKGEAVQRGGLWWEYATKAKGKVRVEARDLAENVTKAEA